MTTTRPTHASRRHPRGGVYVFVLATATLLLVMTVGSMLVIDAQSRRDKTIADSASARVNAQAALELASGTAQNTLQWRRTGIIGGFGVASYTLGGDAVRVDTGDPTDDDLTDSIDDPIELLAEARAGDAREMLLVNLVPYFEGQECLAWSLRVGGDLHLYQTRLVVDAPIGVTGSVKLTNSTIDGDVYAGGTISGAGISGIGMGDATNASAEQRAALASRLGSGGTGAGSTSGLNDGSASQAGPVGGLLGALGSTTNSVVGATSKALGGVGDLAGGVVAVGTDASVEIGPLSVAFKGVSNAPDESMPDPSKVFRHYMYVGTAINRASIPSLTMVNVLLSPTSNPYGPTNAQGIYVIDLANQSLTMTNVRVLGTLVLLNAGSSTRIEEGVLMRPFVSDYPALLVRGKLTVSPTRTLKEASGFNANPAGSPLGGVTDTDTNGEYPSEIRGLVYVNGDLGVSTTSVFTGCVVVSGHAGIGYTGVNIPMSVSNASNRVVLIRQIPTVKPPPGFYKMPGFAVEPASVRRITE